TTLLRTLAGELSGNEEIAVQVVLVGALPEEVTEWRRADGLDVAGGSFDRSRDAQAQAAELAVERAKRRVERGGLTVIAAVGGEREPLRWATTRVVLGPDGKLAAESGTVRADALS